VLLGVDAERLGEGLRWEASRGGDLFPHLYDHLLVSAVKRIDPLPLNADGTHRFEGLLP